MKWELKIFAWQQMVDMPAKDRITETASNLQQNYVHKQGDQISLWKKSPKM
jgi:hypothetical protein